MKNTKLLSRQTRKYIRNVIEKAGTLDKDILLEGIYEDLEENGDKGIKYGFSDNESIVRALKVYILGNDLIYAEKYGLEEILKWEHLKV